MGHLVGVKRMPGISKTVVSLKPGTMEDVTKFLDEKAGEINQTPGGLGFAVAVTGEDDITIIGLYEANQNARDAGEYVQTVFAEMAPFVADPPNRDVFSGAWSQLDSSSEIPPITAPSDIGRILPEP